MASSTPQQGGYNRRKWLQRSTGMAAMGVVSKFAAHDLIAETGQPVNLNKHSAPSQLKITDMRACTVAANYDYPIIRIDTNQGVYGLGEVRDAGVKGIALILKAHLIGKNPLEIKSVLESIRPFAGQGRMGGGYSAVDMALHDIAGKVYGVPSWRLIGSKVRNRIRIYCDTTGHKDPKVYAQRMLKRKQMGFTFFKMDLYTSLTADRPGAIHENGAATEKGLKYLCEYIAAIRDSIGWDAPLAADHFGDLSVNDCIRYARAFEPYQLAWAEDFVSYKDWRGLKAIADATTTPVLTGEDAFGLEEGFQPLIENRAVDIIQPDPETSGALLETKRISDYASLYGISTVLHFAGSPVGCMAAVHLAATLKDFIVMENHAIDMPWWQDLVTGITKPIVESGYITVPDKPGLGVELNDEAVKQHLRYPGYFEPTPMYDDFIVSEFRRVGPWPHYDEEGNYVNAITY
jgi:L-alanine-DL-glutamate epimerase-like enolase superfamily enzyme